jgi:hypothetical protein
MGRSDHDDLYGEMGWQDFEVIRAGQFPREFFS